MINPKNFRHIVAGTATTVLSTKMAVLGSIIVNTAGASSNTLTIYNNTAGSGDVIAVIDTTSANMPQRDFNCICPAGITVVSATGTGADLTVTGEFNF